MSTVDRELTASQKAIQENAQYPNLNNHDIVIELAKHEERLDNLEEANIALNNGVLNGLSQQVNYLQDKVKELEALLSNKADKSAA